MASQTANGNLTLTIKEALRSVESLATPEELEQGKALFAEKSQKQKESKAKEEKKPKLFNLF